MDFKALLFPEKKLERAHQCFFKSLIDAQVWALDQVTNFGGYVQIYVIAEIPIDKVFKTTTESK